MGFHTLLKSQLLRRGFVAPSLAAVFVVGACNDSTGPNGNQRACEESTPITAGTPVTGELSTTDCLLVDNSFADRWQLLVTAATEYQIDLASTDFDTFLLVVNENNSTIQTNDNVDDDTSDSRITITLGPGVYYVVANSLDPGETGGYSLSVTVVE